MVSARSISVSLVLLGACVQPGDRPDRDPDPTGPAWLAEVPASFEEPFVCFGEGVERNEGFDKPSRVILRALDEADRLVREEILDGLDLEVESFDSWTYDGAGRPLRYAFQDKGRKNPTLVEWDYDEAGREVQERRYKAETLERIVHSTWEGELLMLEERDTDADGTIDSVTDWAYDEYGRPKKWADRAPDDPEPWWRQRFVWDGPPPELDHEERTDFYGDGDLNRIVRREFDAGGREILTQVISVMEPGWGGPMLDAETVSSWTEDGQLAWRREDWFDYGVSFESHAYDGEGRILSSRHWGTHTSAWGWIDEDRTTTWTWRCLDDG